MEEDRNFKELKDGSEEEKIIPFPKPQGGPSPTEYTDPAKIATEYLKKHGQVRTHFNYPLWRRLTRSLRSLLGQK